jgi:rhodanese-related sulfurtransferase
MPFGRMSEREAGILCAVAGPVWVATTPTSLTRTMSAPAGDYTPQQVAELLSSGAYQLIDVRQPHEHEAGRIAGDRLIELGRLSEAAASVDRDRPVIFYCRSGGRSAMATQAFAQAGYDAHNMVGGLLDWAAAGLPLEPDGGTVAEA